jgi:murein DD-endopeptidase MepM/ murein hydrolase activator NlpD
VAASSGHAATTQGGFQWPTTRREISGWTFHDPRNPGHIGLDIAARMWDPIVAVADGVVVFAEWGGGYGNLVIVDHDNNWRTYYAHLSEIVVETGQEVRQGELLGGAGSTGYSTGPHLHFELRYQGRPVDPHVHLP